MFIYTVSEVNKFIKQIFSYEQIFYNINIKGEISNFKYHSSGNIFFTLKDENSSIKCIMFKNQVDFLEFLPENGMFVNICGDINVYEKNGTYQVYVSKMKEQGSGILQKKLTNLQEKLANEGLFDYRNKIPIIKVPKVVGIVTAPSGAALQDVIQILSRRLPVLKLKIFPCLVQGVDSANSIAKAIRKVSADKEVNNVIICRGGGSEEDLNPFNDEIVCRAAFECEKPIISAIGHETDNCLLDLVADLRAPTPSAAAELVCVDKTELLTTVENDELILKNNFNTLIEKILLKLKNLQNKLEFASPKNFLISLEIKIDHFLENLKKSMMQIVAKIESKIEENSKMLELLNPLSILKKGYCLAFQNDQKLVKSIYRLKAGTEMTLVFSKGKLKVKILEKTF